MALNEAQIKAMKPSDSSYKAADRDGLYLVVATTGLKTWRYDYSIKGRRKTLTIGRYPDVGLSAARRALGLARDQVRSGEDPSEVKKMEKDLGRRAAQQGQERDESELFEDVGEDFLTWLRGKEPPMAPRTMTKKEWIIRDIAGVPLAGKTMRGIKPSDVLDILRTLESKRQLETAKRTRSTLVNLFDFAIWSHKADVNPVTPLRGAVAPPVHVNHPAIVDEKAFGALLNVVKGYDGWYSVRLALLFLAYTFARPGEVRLAQWSEIDFEEKVWLVPAGRMKMRVAHKVPLSLQAIKILKQSREIDPKSPIIFPSVRSNHKPLSDNTLNGALRRMGYTKDEVVAHGFRSSASTILNERGHDAEIIEVQLSHMNADRVKRIYDRGERWEQRVRLMRDWGRICDRLMIL